MKRTSFSFLCLLGFILFLPLPGSRVIPELAAQQSSSAGNEDSEEVSRLEELQNQPPPEENPEELKVKPGEETIPYSDIAMSLRDLFLSIQPRLRRLKLLRESPKSFTNRIESIKEKLREKQSQLSSVQSDIENAPSDAGKRDNLQQLRKASSYLGEYLKKRLNNWTPTKKERMKMRAWRASQQLENGLASPEVLRKKFLDNLVGYIYFQYARVDAFPPSAHAIRKYKQETRDLFSRFFQTFLSLMARIREVRQKYRKEKEKNGGDNKKEKKGSNDGESGDSTQEKSGQESENKQLKKELRRVRKEVYREWSDQLEEFRSGRKKSFQRLNRILLLFRDRDKLTSLESNMRMNALRLKRRFDILFQAEQSGNIFQDKNKLRKVMIEAGLFYVSSIERVKQRKMPLFMRDIGRVFDQVPGKETSGADEEVYRKKLEQASGSYSGNLGKDVQEVLSDWDHDGARAISERLQKDYGKQEKRLGNVISGTRKVSKNLQDWIKRAKETANKVSALYKKIENSNQKNQKKAIKQALKNIREKEQELYKSFRSISQKFKKLSRKKQRLASDFSK